MLAKEKTWKRIFNTNSELSQNRTEKQIMPFKTTVNWLFNDIWCYLVIGCFDWKIGVFQQTVARFYYILKPICSWKLHVYLSIYVTFYSGHQAYGVKTSELFYLTAQNWRFPWKISSVNVAKPTGKCSFGDTYWKNP